MIRISHICSSIIAVSLGDCCVLCVYLLEVRNKWSYSYSYWEPMVSIF